MITARRRPADTEIEGVAGGTCLVSRRSVGVSSCASSRFPQLSAFQNVSHTSKGHDTHRVSSWSECHYIASRLGLVFPDSLTREGYKCGYSVGISGIADLFALSLPFPKIVELEADTRSRISLYAM